MITDRDIPVLRALPELRRTPVGDILTRGPMTAAEWEALVAWVLKERLGR